MIGLYRIFRRVAGIAGLYRATTYPDFYAPTFSSLLVVKAPVIQESHSDPAPFLLLPTPASRRTDSLSGKRALLCGCRPVKNKREVLIQEAIAVMADGDVIGEEDDFSWGMRAGLLFCRGQRSEAFRCSLFLVQGKTLFGVGSRLRVGRAGTGG